MVTFDSELRAHNERLRAAAGIRAGDRVLDVGCGAGQTTREAARAAGPGEVLGIDVSADALERARELTATDGLDNVTYEQRDAQTYRFASGRFDVAISRFGVMFFADPFVAFGNIARALRSGGRMVLLVWQRREANEWEVAINDALGTWAEAGDGPDPFSLGDPAATERILARAGFHSIRHEDVDEPVFYGADVDDALDWVRGFHDVSRALAALDRAGRDNAIESLRATFAAHRTADRVTFGSRAWLVTARRG
jgi:SAM-dependent methyltransferase